MPSFADLLTRFADIHNLDMANAVLNWDQRTYMPARGGEARAKQLATLAKLSHNLLVSTETQDLLAVAEATKPTDENHRAILRVARRNIDKAVKVPLSLVVDMTETCSRAEDIWQTARKDNDYKTFAPWLDKVLKLKRQYAAAVEPTKPIYDALLDDYEEGMTTTMLDPVFETLKKETIPLVAAIAEQTKRGKGPTEELLTRNYPPAAQQTFATQILKDCGFSFDRGRLDVSTHPFCTNFDQNDVRITTRYENNWLPGALFGCMHEMGHAFYEMNIDPAFEATPLSGGVSLGVHESQSRLWENMVGRSREFWSHYYPQLQSTFPTQLADVQLDAFYRSINTVSPTLIRVESDEITYNLRYEMEQALLSGNLSVADAPAAWNDKMKASLGITPPTNREGILQDVHWSGGGIGYFPTYTLGNILSAQLFEAAGRDLPSLRTDIANAHFTGLYDWLTTHVHRHGKKFPPAELIPLATGKSLTTVPYLHYLNAKFRAIYEL